MRQPPRSPHRRLLNARMLAFSMLEGATTFAATACVYVMAWQSGLDQALVASLTFASVVAGNLGLIAVNRSDEGLGGAIRPNNAAFWWIVALASLTLAASLYAQPLSALFRFARPAPSWLAGALVMPLLAVAAVRFGRYILQRQP